MNSPVVRIHVQLHEGGRSFKASAFNITAHGISKEECAMITDS